MRQVRAVDAASTTVLSPQRDAGCPRRPGSCAVPSLPGQLLVEGALESRAERLVGADEADQVGPDVAGRVVPDRVAAGVEPLEARAPAAPSTTSVASVGGHPAGDVLEAAAPCVAEPVESVEVVERPARRRGIGPARAPGRAVSCGSATTISPSIESASGSPLRSRMSPRVGGQHDLDRALGGRHLRRRSGGPGPAAGPAGRRRPTAPSRSRRSRRAAAAGASRGGSVPRGRTTRSRRHDSSSAGSRISGRHGWSSRGPACSH